MDELGEQNWFSGVVLYHFATSQCYVDQQHWQPGSLLKMKKLSLPPRSTAFWKFLFYIGLTIFYIDEQYWVRSGNLHKPLR